MNYKILVIIVTYNGEKRSDKVIKCLNNSHQKVDTIIIDNGSTDNTLDIFEKGLKGEYKIVKNDKNLGFGGANNIGFEYAIKNNYDYVYLLNQDARFFEDTVGELIKICEKNKDLGIISPFQCSSDLMKIDKNFQNGVIGYESNKDIISDIYFDNLKEAYNVGGVMAAHRFMPVSVIMRVGGFSPTFFHYGEDSNYTDRVRYLGYKILVTPSLRVVHDRYNREDTNDKKIWLGYTGALIILSNPFEKGWRKRFIVIAMFLYHMVIYKSFKPLKYLGKIFINLGKIKKNKKLSINGKCPFLK